MESGVPTGPRGGTHRDRGSNIPTPQYRRYRVTHAGSYLRTQHAFSEPTLIWAAKGDLPLMNRGVVSHRARFFLACYRFFLGRAQRSGLSTWKYQFSIDH